MLFLSHTFGWEGRGAVLGVVEAVVDEALLQLALRLKQHVLDDQSDKDHHEDDVVQPSIQQSGEGRRLSVFALLTD